MSILRFPQIRAVPCRCLVIGLLAASVTSGRATAFNSPTVDVLGSYFPAWLICIVAGLILTVVARLLLIAWKLEAHLLAKPIVYPCLLAVFALTAWLILFQN